MKIEGLVCPNCEGDNWEIQNKFPFLNQRRELNEDWKALACLDCEPKGKHQYICFWNEKTRERIDTKI